MPKDYLVCTLPCLGYFDTSYYCAVLSDQLSQYKPIPRPNFAPESSYVGDTQVIVSRDENGGLGLPNIRACADRQQSCYASNPHARHQ